MGSAVQWKRRKGDFPGGWADAIVCLCGATCTRDRALDRLTTKSLTLSVSVWGSQVSVKVIFLHMRIYDAWNSTTVIEAPQRFSKNVSSKTKLKCTCYTVLVKFPRFHSFSRGICFMAWLHFTLGWLPGSEGSPPKCVARKPMEPSFLSWAHSPSGRYILPTRLTGENRATSFHQEVVCGTCARN